MDDLLNIFSDPFFDSSLDFFEPGVQSGSTGDTFQSFGDIGDIDIGDIDIGDIDIDVGDIDIDFGGGDRDPITGFNNDQFWKIWCDLVPGLCSDPQISINDTKITEGNRGRKTARFNVTLDQESDEVVKVNYTTVNGSAKAGQDYKRTRGTLTFQPGQTQKAIAIPILGDEKVENDETFTVNLSQPQNGKIEDNQGIATIQDNDLAKISIRDAKITEGNRGKKQAKFTVTLNSEVDETVRVNYATVNGTAKARSDYQTTKGTLTFRPGQRRKTISVPILGDTLDEENEKFQVVLSKPRNAKLGDRRAIGTIIDNDIQRGDRDGNFKKATNIGRLNSRFVNSDSIGYTEVGNRDTNDFYRFRLPREGKLRVVLDELFDDANIALYDSEQSLISTSRKRGTSREQILQTLDRGVYYLRVTPQGSDRTDYRMELKFI
ncbi:MAG: hypothetical protein F6K40_28040 [Okeania sp. SIO3I5]|uniref:PPC domain-containing protein n=1 Tax=Okeania sp. SIO3I5 TaxID=2607805 RepID=UPI0013BCEB74|nr:Calx-beta domain-containing protein [Okeania sp. SIO3I5]NEQ39892.1 hypothetical protein [Okeania sp. SIO3I5]